MNAPAKQMQNPLDLFNGEPLADVFKPGAPQFFIEEHTHTKKNFQMYIVILAHRVQRAEFDRLLSAAQLAGGWYSRQWGNTPGGFAFKQQDQAHQYAADNLQGPQPTAAAPTAPTLRSVPASVPVKPRIEHGAKLRALADGMQSAIDNKLADRLENTAKRMGQGAHARLEGYQLQRTQKALYALADMHDAGECPEILQGFKSKAAIHAHMIAKKCSVSNGWHGYSVEESPLQPHDTIAKDPATLALWQLIGKKDPAREKADKLKQAINGVKMSNIPGYFPTPAAVVAQMIEAAEIEDYHNVLEPSAGDGAIACAIPEECMTVVFEKNYSLCEILKLRGFDARPIDFLEREPIPSFKFDRVLMNPPFELQQDIQHVLHAYKFLKPGGRLVAIMSPSWQQRENTLSASFRDWMTAHNGEVIELPEGSFKESGTNVNTVMIVVNVPRDGL